MDKNYLKLWCTALLITVGVPVFAQVLNGDNEDAVNKIDAHASKYDYVNGQVLVKFSDNQTVRVNNSGKKFASTNYSQLTNVLQKYGVEEMEQLLPNENPRRTMRKARAFNGTVVEEKDLSQLYCLKLSEENCLETMKLVSDLQELSEVEFAEPNYRIYALENDVLNADYNGNPYVTSQWYLDAYGVKELWDKPIINKKRPIIAIIDTGVDMTHPDLVDNLWTNQKEADGEEGYDNDGNGFAGDVHGWDFINNTPNVRDFNMHGTHVAGIAAASNNGIGIIGANPQAYIMPVSVLQSDGTGDVATIIKGINYAVANGATVLNLSLGTYANSRAMRQALEKAYQTAVIVAAAGNDGKCVNITHYDHPAAPTFPAAYSFVLGVQATNQNGKRAGFSNYDDDGKTYSSYTTLQDPDGFNYELQAPGCDMLSTIPGGKYNVLNGTSMATPLVAGAISALKMVKEYDTQEILWGDLLHTNNIAQAYAVTIRPAELDLMKLQYRERKEISKLTEDDYSDDGEIDAGETVSIYPVIRTTFGAASNIKMHLEMGDEFEDPNTVQILTETVDFGMTLDAYGRGVSMNPLKLKVADNVSDGRHIKMKLVTTCDETDIVYECPFTLIVSNMVKIHGLITEDMTLTADHIYYVNENIAIPEGVTLTIEPGTRLEFAEGMGLSSFGQLVAKGTPENPIVFTGHNGEIWAGIISHGSSGATRSVTYPIVYYTNEDQTLFTLLPTEITPYEMYAKSQEVYYGVNEEAPSKSFELRDYTKEIRFDGYLYAVVNPQSNSQDPNFLTPAILQMFSEWEAYCNQYSAHYSLETPNSTRIYTQFFPWITYDHPIDTLSYCKIENLYQPSQINPIMKDCEVFLYDTSGASIDGIRCNISNINGVGSFFRVSDLRYSNIVNNFFGYPSTYIPDIPYNDLDCCNYFNNYYICTRSGKYKDKEYSLGIKSPTPSIIKSDTPSYLGTSRESLVRPYIYELGNAPETYSQIDLSNMRTTPIPDAHGIVWKVCVNGKDAQDEYEELAPLGVGRHKFEVYFNRPMNKTVMPNISFGVRDPYTQNGVNEDGSWNEEGTIYTAFKTITGKTKSDGVNRIYVFGAEDNEFFEIPIEKRRFNIRVQAAGSMATGFAADAGMGRVLLTWNNEENDFEDAMGFNLYRYHEYEELRPVYGEWGRIIYETDEDGNYVTDEWGNRIQKQEWCTLADTICLNTDILDNETNSFIDYDVTPGETYHYYYKVLSTDLQEYDISNIVAATPLTSTLGDANGSGDVDVADVITTVNYAAGLAPKPFIFEAADMNKDENIDILDVVGIIQKILNPRADAKARVETTAVYTVENGIVYVETPVALSGVQVQLNIPEEITPATLDPLSGFEHASAWLTNEDYLLLAYNLNGKTIPVGKHALLNIGHAQLRNIRLSDTTGSNVMAEAGNATAIEMRTAKVLLNTHGIYNLNGQKVAGSAADLEYLPKGVYVVDGQKVLK